MENPTASNFGIKIFSFRTRIFHLKGIQAFVYRLLNCKAVLPVSLQLCLILVLGVGNVLGQQVIGTYPGMNGGYEGATIDNTVFSSAQSGKWVKNNATQTIGSESTTVRSGSTSLSATNGSTGRRIWTPLVTVSSTTSSVTIQYYRRVLSTTNTQESQSAVGNGTTTDASPGSYSVPSSANTWEKVTYTRTSWTFTDIAGAVLTRSIGTGGTIFIDDLVMYNGSVDNTAPNSPGSVTISNATSSSLDISWVAASGGVDGGGYVVVRYSSNPNADNDPNQNGIYAVGNTTTNGTGSLTGTIRYIGTGNSFTDNVGLSSGTQYWYKVYTVDKAFNYSTESSGNGTTTVSTSNPTLNSVTLNSALTTTYGTASSGIGFTASGSNLTSNITATAQSGYEVSTSSGSGYGASVSVASGTTVYLRMNSTLPAGSYNGATAVVLSGGGSSVDANVTTSASSNAVSTKTLTITGLSVSNKEYDATTAVTINGTPAYSGLVNSESFSVSGSPTWAFATKTVGTNKTINRTGNYTAPSANYTVTQPSGLTATITAKTLTVTSAAASNKTYDGTTTATISGTLAGVISGDVVTLSGTGTFASANAGIGISVTSTSTLSGTDAANYSLTQPTGLTANITQATQTIVFGALPAKTTADVPFACGATSATSGTNALTYTSSNTSVATINASGSITIVGVGTTTITVSQSGSANYSAASDVAQTLTVTVPPCGDEGFEAGLPTSYSTTTSYYLNTGTWTGQAIGVIRGTSGVNTGSYSVQLRTQTGAQITSPIITSGVGSVVFWGSSSTVSGSVQLNYSIDGGANWIAAPGSPFALTTGTPVQFVVNLNNSNPNILLQFYRTASTVYLDDISWTCYNLPAGEYRTRQNGNWGTNTTWEKWDGSAWVACSSGDYPNSSNSNVTIRHLVDNDGSGTPPWDVNNLTVENGAKLWDNQFGGTNSYIQMYGDIVCNGTIGDPNGDDISFDIVGGNDCTISGTGSFTATRLRKDGSINSTTDASLTIDMDVRLTWSSSSGAVLYNDGSASNFNVVINSGKTVRGSGPGSALANVAIDGNNFSSPDPANAGGTITVNGILDIDGILYAYTDNSLRPCEINITNGGTVKCRYIRTGSSGVAGSTLRIYSGGKLNIFGSVDTVSASLVDTTWRNFSSTNNTWDFQPGGTIEYSGATQQRINGISACSNFIVSGGGLKKLGNDFTVAGNLTLTSGRVQTDAYRLIHTSTNASSLIHSTGSASFVFGTYRRYIASNTSVYELPVGLSSATSGYRRADLVNNNLSGVTYVDASVGSLSESGNNIDSRIACSQNGTALTDVLGSTIWSLVPSVQPSSGFYGVRLYVSGTGLSAADDNTFCPVKRTSGSTDFADWNTFETSTSIPSSGTAGRIYASGNGYAERNGYTSFSEHAIGKAPSNQPLPVELYSFTANCLGEDNVKLMWVTASENNSSHFVIENSVNGVDWNVAGIVNAAGTSQETLEYEFAFRTNSSLNYVRLKQVDKDGEEVIYPEISVVCSSNYNTLVTIPNPSGNEFTAVFDSEINDSSIEIQLTDIQGRDIFSKRFNVSKGLNFIALEGQTWPAGVYYLKVTAADGKVQLIRHRIL